MGKSRKNKRRNTYSPQERQQRKLLTQQQQKQLDKIRTIRFVVALAAGFLLFFAALVISALAG